MKKFRPSPISSINVVPYLDVMLVLLVIFMITAPLFNQGAVNLPEVDPDASLDSPAPAALEVVWHADGNMQLTDHSLAGETGEKKPRENILLEMKDILILNPDGAPPVVISADASLEYGEVLEFLGELQAAGFDNIGLAIRSRQG